MWQHWLAFVALTWYAIVLLVITIGIVQLYRHFTSETTRSQVSQLSTELVPHVTVIRPIVGTDPFLYECLASTFRQDYPSEKLSVHFCIPTRDEPALPILHQLLKDFPEYDARIHVADEDPILQQQQKKKKKHNGSERKAAAEQEVLGPNPKIRNMSRAYREAKGDIIWIIDCNVWAGASVAGHMVDKLCGLDASSGGKKYKFAHQIPLATDVSDLPINSASAAATPSSLEPAIGLLPTGNRLEEMFLSTSHAKFYTAISTVAIAPCTVGKSNMFRRSHLDALTAPSATDPPGRSAGIDFFSENICEDHLISDLLWRSPVPDSVRELTQWEGRPRSDGPLPASSHLRRNWGNHALLLQPPCIQPIAGVTLSSYMARRSRWLRVRKFTVPAATAVEPGTESFVATAGAAYALTTLPYFRDVWHVPGDWQTFWSLWITGVTLWCVKDWLIWGMLQRWQGVGEVGAADKVPFVGRGASRRKQEGVLRWLQAWLGRECLAFPIWAWAILGGVTVTWRGKRFWVGLDMKVHEIWEAGGDREVRERGKDE